MLLSQKVTYKTGYKYQLAETFTAIVPIKPEYSIDSFLISLDTKGYLVIKKGYAWDGASGAIDTSNFMRGALVHDALYQLMRQGSLDPQVHRKTADEWLRAVCLEDGMSRFRAWYVYVAVRFFGATAASYQGKKEISTAP
jgi:hypothetical protein